MKKIKLSEIKNTQFIEYRFLNVYDKKNITAHIDSGEFSDYVGKYKFQKTKTGTLEFTMINQFRVHYTPLQRVAIEYCARGITQVASVVKSIGHTEYFRVIPILDLIWAGKWPTRDTDYVKDRIGTIGTQIDWSKTIRRRHLYEEAKAWSDI